tara:strand:+ start:1714 stop:2520 length:807 start_codon:yes stop_codon:yes gene_type:complete
MAFKMKGNPMQRNFGIGSPVKHKMDKRGFEHGNKHHSETVSDSSGTGHSKSPAKDRVTDLTGMDKKGKQAATAHNDAHASGGDPHSKKSPAEKKLIGAQNNLPEELKAKIEASPAKQANPKSMIDDFPGKNTRKKTKEEKEKIQAETKREQAEIAKMLKKYKESLNPKPSSPAKQVTREQRLTDSSQSAPADATPRELYKKRKATKKPQKAPEKQASPAKQKELSKAEKRANLLKVVPNKEAYNKLSDLNKKGFDKAGKEVGLPQKKA